MIMGQSGRVMRATDNWLAKNIAFPLLDICFSF
jgi:hypothetical protein